MCVHSWACKPSELVWSWCWKVLYSIIFSKNAFFLDSYHRFWHFISTFLFKNTKLSIKKWERKKKLTLIFRYFGSVGKGQTNILFLGLIVLPSLECKGFGQNELGVGSFTGYFNTSVSEFLTKKTYDWKSLDIWCMCVIFFWKSRWKWIFLPLPPPKKKWNYRVKLCQKCLEFQPPVWGSSQFIWNSWLLNKVSSHWS